MEELRFWSDVSAIFLMLQGFVMLAFLLVSLYFAVRGMLVILRKAREYLALTRRYFDLVENVVVRSMDALVSPFMFVSSLSAGLSEGLKSLWAGKR